MIDACDATRQVLLAAAVIGCGARSVERQTPNPSTPPQIAVSTVELAAVIADRVVLYRASGDGVVKLRDVAVPATIEDLAWVRHRVVVLLHPNDTYGAAVGWIAAAGFEALPLPPLAQMRTDHKRHETHFDRAWVKLAVANGEIWLGRCEWGEIGDGDACTEWKYARLDPLPKVVRTQEPADDRPVWDLPTIAPPPSMRVALVADPIAPAGQPRELLSCTRRGVTVEIPPRETRESNFFGMSKLRWLSADPPLFRVVETVACESLCDESVIFEGCERSDGLSDAEVIVGPSDTFAIRTTARTSVRWRDRELGTIDGASKIVFAPR